MLRLLRILIISFFYFIIGATLDSCIFKCEDYNFDFESFKLRNIKFNPEYASSEDVSDTCCFLYSQFGLRIELKSKEYSNIRLKQKFSNTLMAYDCWPQGNLQHKIEKIQVFTLNDFDEYHKTNSDISDYFIGRNLYKKELEPVDSILNNFLNISDRGRGDREIDLILRKAPQIDSLFQFVVKIKLTNKELIDTTQIIKIQK